MELEGKSCASTVRTFGVSPVNSVAPGPLAWLAAGYLMYNARVFMFDTFYRLWNWCHKFSGTKLNKNDFFTKVKVLGPKGVTTSPCLWLYRGWPK